MYKTKHMKHILLIAFLAFTAPLYGQQKTTISVTYSDASLNDLHLRVVKTFMGLANEVLKEDHFSFRQPTVNIMFDTATKEYTATMACMFVPSAIHYHNKLYRRGVWYHAKDAQKQITKMLKEQPYPKDKEYNEVDYDILSAKMSAYSNYLMCEEVFYAEVHK